MEFNSRKIFVGNLPFTATKNDLEKMFESYGHIIGVNVREDRLTGKPKGFAFVTFEDDVSATNAIAGMHGYSYGGRSLTVNRASIRGSDEKVPGQSEVDNSWKTVPIPAPSARPKSGKAADKGKADTGKKQAATWDQWAGPITKPSATSVRK